MAANAAILKAAVELFAEQGFEGASIRELAARPDGELSSVEIARRITDFLLAGFGVRQP